jgi:hypothetical protein
MIAGILRHVERASTELYRRILERSALALSSQLSAFSSQLSGLQLSALSFQPRANKECLAAVARVKSERVKGERVKVQSSKFKVQLKLIAES